VYHIGYFSTNPGRQGEPVTPVRNARAQAGRTFRFAVKAALIAGYLDAVGRIGFSKKRPGIPGTCLE
jgi:hypothetical protein